MKSGIFKLFGVLPDESGEKLFQYGRILITDTDTFVIEDNRDFIVNMFPDGPLDADKTRRWAQITRSPYMRVEPDEMEKPAENHHTGEPKPEAIFDLLDQDGTNHRVEVYSNDNLWIDGSHISEKAAKHIFEQVRIGRFKLLPK